MDELCWDRSECGSSYVAPFTNLNFISYFSDDKDLVEARNIKKGGSKSRKPRKLKNKSKKASKCDNLPMRGNLTVTMQSFMELNLMENVDV